MFWFIDYNGLFLSALFFAFVHNMQNNGFNNYIAVNNIAWPVSKVSLKSKKVVKYWAAQSMENTFRPWLSSFIFCKNTICNNLCSVPTTKCTNCPHICPSVATKFFMDIPAWFMKACALCGVGKRHSAVQTCTCTIPTVNGEFNKWMLVLQSCDSTHGLQVKSVSDNS